MLTGMERCHLEGQWCCGRNITQPRLISNGVRVSIRSADSLTRAIVAANESRRRVMIGIPAVNTFRGRIRHDHRGNCTSIFTRLVAKHFALEAAQPKTREVDHVSTIVLEPSGLEEGLVISRISKAQVVCRSIPNGKFELATRTRLTHHQGNSIANVHQGEGSTHEPWETSNETVQKRMKQLKFLHISPVIWTLCSLANSVDYTSCNPSLFVGACHV